MSALWQLQEAKNKLSQVVEQAMHEGPQEITRHGRKAAVVLSVKDYQRLKPRRGTLVDFFRRSPLRGISLERVKDMPRGVDL